MSSSIDYIGKDCPLCGAKDSLDIDDARGEVGCTECAAVIAMGLEENALTRFEKDATMMDVDHGARSDRGGGENTVADRAVALAQSNVLSRTEAAALAAGIVGPVNAQKKLYDQYMKITLPPSTMRFMEDLVALSRRHNAPTIMRKAIELAKLFLGRRKTLGIKTQGERETAAACVLIAAGLDGQPIPSAELYVLNHTLRHVEQRRQEILDETQVSAEDVRRLRDNFEPDLVHHYIRLLNLQFSRYARACLTLARTLKHVSARHRSLEGLSEAERALAAVLLARSEPSIVWDSKPPYDPNSEPQPSTFYDGFAATAHLDATRVRTVMKTVQAVLPDIARAFTVAMTSAAAQDTMVKKETEERSGAGTKRPRQD